jgi:hypothetical protein
MRFHTLGQPLKSLFAEETLLVSSIVSPGQPADCDRQATRSSDTKMFGRSLQAPITQTKTPFDECRMA